MLSKDIREHMELEDIPPLLEELGCDYIQQHNHTYITCSRPGGDNKQGVVIWYNNGLFTVQMYTDPSFEQYAIQDIFAFVQHILEVPFPTALDWVAGRLGLSEKTVKKKKRYSSLEWLEAFERKTICESEEDRVLPEATLDQFKAPLHNAWASEGVSQEVADKFSIGYDSLSDAITIPIRDANGNLVGIKARNLRDSDCKFCYIYRTKKTHHLYGYWENYDAIKEKGEVLVFESEKSVLKAASVGINNTCAIAGKKISDHQAELLLRLNVRIILALDANVTIEEIRETRSKINFPVTFTEILMIDNVSASVPEKDCIADCLDKIVDYKDYVAEIR